MKRYVDEFFRSHQREERRNVLRVDLTQEDRETRDEQYLKPNQEFPKKTGVKGVRRVGLVVQVDRDEASNMTDDETAHPAQSDHFEGVLSSGMRGGREEIVS